LFKLVSFGIVWSFAMWYGYESYSNTKTLGKSIISMFHLLRVGICENRKSIGEIVSEEAIFAENNAQDFSMFLWENHEILGLESDLIDSYNAFLKNSEMSSGCVCDEGIVELERAFKEAVCENQAAIKSKYISFITLCSAVLAVFTIVLV